jgi:phosphatidylglycerophosphatase A
VDVNAAVEKKYGRRPLHWERVRGPRKIIALFIATAAGAGLLPKAPGTFGTIVGLPIAYFTRDWPIIARVGLWTALTVAGTWSAQVFDQTMQSTDNQNIVIDEVVGMGITAWTLGGSLPTGWQGWLAAFLLFRLFDMWKPYPIRLVDVWSKKSPAWSGFGVMADDILAGFYGLLCIILLQHFGFFLTT